MDNQESCREGLSDFTNLIAYGAWGGAGVSSEGSSRP
jgi:hypothetical protein